MSDGAVAPKGAWEAYRAQQDGMRWPGGRHVAVIVNVAYEGWSDGKAPGIGPMGNPLPSGAFDTNARSWGNYGKYHGIDRILRLLDRTKVRASIMVSGILAERVPENVRAIAGAGHEIIGHSYAQDVVPASLSAEDDKKNVDRTTELIEAAIGRRPKGWASPRSTPSDHTLRSLIDAGYTWHSDAMDSDGPYERTFDNGSIVAIPFAMDINDLPHSMRFGRTPAEFIQMADEFVSKALLNDDGPVIIDITAHTHCYARPGTAWAFEEVIRKVSQRDDVWLTVREDLVTHYQQSRKR